MLDCACGTGWHAIALAQRGYRVAGSDISAAMIARARENAAREGVTIPFAVAGFQELRAMFRERFDAVLCLGNSLPHVLTDDAALESLANMRDRLRAGRRADPAQSELRQTLARKAALVRGELGTIAWTRDAHLAVRGLRRRIDHVQHRAVYERRRRPWSVEVQSTPQRPYRKDEIEICCAELASAISSFTAVCRASVRRGAVGRFGCGRDGVICTVR